MLLKCVFVWYEYQWFVNPPVTHSPRTTSSSSWILCCFHVFFLSFFFQGRSSFYLEILSKKQICSSKFKVQEVFQFLASFVILSLDLLVLFLRLSYIMHVQVKLILTCEAFCTSPGFETDVRYNSKMASWLEFRTLTFLFFKKNLLNWFTRNRVCLMSPLTFARNLSH